MKKANLTESEAQGAAAVLEAEARRLVEAQGFGLGFALEIAAIALREAATIKIYGRE